MQNVSGLVSMKLEIFSYLHPLDPGTGRNENRTEQNKTRDGLKKVTVI